MMTIEKREGEKEIFGVFLLSNVYIWSLKKWSCGDPIIL